MVFRFRGSAVTATFPFRGTFQPEAQQILTTAVLYDRAQTLSTAQKAQARSNISAAPNDPVVVHATDYGVFGDGADYTSQLQTAINAALAADTGFIGCKVILP